MHRYLALALVPLLALLGGTTALAAPIGALNLTNCLGGGLVLTLSSLDWVQPAGGGSGCIATGFGTNLTYSGGSLPPGTTGLILDLPAGSLPVADFMVFAVAPNLHFDLTALGPGSANTACATGPSGLSCSVAPGSPFILTPTATGTALSLSALGVARDLSGVTSFWSGDYTTQFAGVTPAAIQGIILGGGGVTGTYSGAFVVSTAPAPVPDPGSTLFLFGMGLVGLRAWRKRLQ